MQRYEFIFLDIDDTILDFGAAERAAYSGALALHGIPCSEDLLERYRKVNVLWWEKMERGEADREEMLVDRHRDFFAREGIDADPAAFEADYRRLLGIGHWFVEGAEEILGWLRQRGCRLFIASNGVSDTQYSRIESAGIGPFFERIFISEEIGFHKPDPGYFRYCFAQIPGFDPERALLIGDSLTSDIRGAKNAGIASCWFNRSGKTAPPELRPDYEITSLAQIKRFL